MASLFHTTTILFSRFLLTAVACSASDAERWVELPSCGVASTYAMLHLEGKDVTLAALRERFRDINPEMDWNRISMRALRDVLNDCGVPAKSVRFPARELGNVVPPAILYFRPGKWLVDPARVNGHFVVLTGVFADENEVRVFDWNKTGYQAMRSLPLNDVVVAWDGEAVIVHDTSTIAPWISTACVVLVATMIGVVVHLKHRRAPSRQNPANQIATTLVPLLACIVGLNGCGRSENLANKAKEPPPPLLRFEKPSIHLGRVRSRGPIRQSFPFSVAANGPVTITDIQVCCGLSHQNQNIVGRKLNAGATDEIVLETNVYADVSPRTVFARLSTDPPSSHPIVLGIAYQYVEPPTPSVRTLTVESLPDSVPTAVFTTKFWHMPDEEGVRLLIDKCSCSHFEIIEATPSSETFTMNEYTDQKAVLDTTRFRLRARQAMGYGEHSGILRLMWSDGFTNDLPTLIRVAPPFVPSLSRVFVGVLGPGQNWTKSVGCRRREEVDFSVKAVETSSSVLRAKLAEDRQTLELSGTAPSTAGRFTAEVVIRFEPDSIPPCRLPVSGIVKPTTPAPGS